MASSTSNLSATSTCALTQAQAGTLSGGSITSETRKQVFDLDHVGNWTHTDLITGGSTTEFDWDFTHNKVNEITGWDNQTNNVTPTYDAAGNMADDKRNWKYEYDAWYRLVRVKDQSNNVKAEFVYNALGYRLSARYDETAPWQYFAYDERWRIVAMYEDDAEASAPTEQFWYHNAGASGLGGSSYIDDVVLRDRDTDGNGTLDERRYYLQNQHHDVVALINTSGSISERVNYDPYGSPIGTFTSIANRKGYAGYEYDAQLGNTHHIRHRVYRSDLGVWTRRDPLGYVDGMGLYEYVESSPHTATDPLGLGPELTSGPLSGGFTCCMPLPNVPLTHFCFSCSVTASVAPCWCEETQSWQTVSITRACCKVSLKFGYARARCLPGGDGGPQFAINETGLVPACPCGKQLHGRACIGATVQIPKVIDMTCEVCIKMEGLHYSKWKPAGGCTIRRRKVKGIDRIVPLEVHACFCFVWYSGYCCGGPFQH